MLSAVQTSLKWFPDIYIKPLAARGNMNANCTSMTADFTCGRNVGINVNRYVDDIFRASPFKMFIVNVLVFVQP